MKTITSIALLAASLASVTAIPVAEPVPAPEEDLKFALVARQYVGSDTENQLTDGTPCRDVTVIFARGTSESGNVGSLAGPPFFQALAAEIGADNLAVQGVDYSASIPGFLAGGDVQGSVTMAALVEQAASQCPDTKIVMSGYSQGGQLVHNAADLLSAAVTAQINSVVIFGDPDNGEAVGTVPASDVDIICHSGDNICEHGIIITAAHLTYSVDAGSAADFVASHAGY